MKTESTLMPPTLVSIIIPVYNAEIFLHRCLDSVINQDYLHLDIIVLDDGSTDRSVSIIESYLDDKRVRLIKKINSGPSDTRNKGIERAEGEYICFVDADDFVTPDYVSVFMNNLYAYDLPDLIVTDYTEYSVYHPKGVGIRQMKEEGIYTAVDFAPCLFTGTMGVLWGKLFKTTIIKEENLQLDSNIRIQEDLLFVFTYLKYCNSILYTKSYTYHYNRLNEMSLTGKFQSYHIEEFEKVQRAMLILAENAKIKKTIQDRALSFYGKYMLYLGNQFGLRQFRSYTKQINYKKYAKQYKGKKIYEVFFFLIQGDFFMPAHIYIQMINRVRKIKLKL